MREAADYFGMPTSVPEAVGSVEAWCAGWGWVGGGCVGLFTTMATA